MRQPFVLKAHSAISAPCACAALEMEYASGPTPATPNFGSEAAEKAITLFCYAT